MNRRDLGSCLLILAGSGVDAMVILGFNVLTAAQTGNTILFSVAVARGDWVTGLGSAISIAAFVCGAVGGGFLCRAGRTRWALVAEGLLLVGALALWSVVRPDAGAWTANMIVAGAAAAMGLQSAVIVAVHGHPTTYITGLLTSFAVALGGPRKPGAPSAAMQGLLWILYLCGAIATGLVSLGIGSFALLLPILALVSAFVVLLPETARPALHRNIK